MANRGLCRRGYRAKLGDGEEDAMTYFTGLSALWFNSDDDHFTEGVRIQKNRLGLSVLYSVMKTT
ncbi:hypothetical protein MHB77_17900 [Paenibacillus sp. FSL K6-3166]|uniref:hypothetical protein n=1 Tax=Paenibacillus sp. FSL K6-3166 TaxID=2921492 RepID=UPI000BA0C910|nr:hypothetical protein CA598_10985 [Paenibacillus sp. VTT E-133291]